MTSENQKLLDLIEGLLWDNRLNYLDLHFIEDTQLDTYVEFYKPDETPDIVKRQYEVRENLLTAKRELRYNKELSEELKKYVLMVYEHVQNIEPHYETMTVNGEEVLVFRELRKA